MNRLSPRPLALLLGLPILLIGGCPGVTIDVPGLGSVALPGLGVITLELYNDTDYYVDPRIRFDDDSGFWAGLWPAEELATGTLAPGEVLTFSFDCDDLGLVLSDEPELLAGPWVYTGDSSAVVERDEDYDCGDRIELQFIGNPDSFGVVVAVNGVVVG